MSIDYEREHCEIQSLRFHPHMDRGEIVDILIRERAAARAEGYAMSAREMRSAGTLAATAANAEQQGWKRACAEWEPALLKQREMVADRDRRIAELEAELARLKS